MGSEFEYIVLREAGSGDKMVRGGGTKGPYFTSSNAKSNVNDKKTYQFQTLFSSQNASQKW